MFAPRVRPSALLAAHSAPLRPVHAARRIPRSPSLVPPHTQVQPVSGPRASRIFAPATGDSSSALSGPNPGCGLYLPARRAMPLRSLGEGGGLGEEGQTTGQAGCNHRKMNTYARSAANPCEMNTYKITALQVSWNEYLQKIGVGRGELCYLAAGRGARTRRQAGRQENSHSQSIPGGVFRAKRQHEARFSI